MTVFLQISQLLLIFESMHSLKIMYMNMHSLLVFCCARKKNYSLKMRDAVEPNYVTLKFFAILLINDHIFWHISDQWILRFWNDYLHTNTIFLMNCNEFHIFVKYYALFTIKMDYNWLNLIDQKIIKIQSKITQFQN